jgi:hypothetical protein
MLVDAHVSKLQKETATSAREDITVFNKSTSLPIAEMLNNVQLFSEHIPHNLRLSSCSFLSIKPAVYCTKPFICCICVYGDLPNLVLLHQTEECLPMNIVFSEFRTLISSYCSHVVSIGYIPSALIATLLAFKGGDLR